jgi:hypothetical protein
MTADDLELAYLAGAIDSDGTIGVKRSTYAMRVTGDANAPVFSERLALRQVTPIIPQMLKARFGGSLYMTKPYSARGKPLWSWAATDLKANAALLALLPYLRIKRGQALNCIALRALKAESKIAKVATGRGHAGAAHRPAELTARMDALYAQAKALNAVGQQAA